MRIQWIVAGLIVGGMGWNSITWATLRVSEPAEGESPLSGFTVGQFEQRAGTAFEQIAKREQLEHNRLVLPLKVQSTPPWDQNGDGKVNIFDLVLVAREVGKQGTVEPQDLTRDVNGDGKVNRQDLEDVAAHFLHTFVTAAEISASDADEEAVLGDEKEGVITDPEEQPPLAPAAGGLNLRFTDVTKEAGIKESKRSTDVVLGDFDSDGHLDIYVVHQGKNRFYRNNGDGTFAQGADFVGIADPGKGTAAAFGDYDNDGDLDLFVANNGQDALYRNEGRGRFKDVTAKVGIGDLDASTAAGFFDYDNDGDLDLYLVNFGSANRLYENVGMKGFKEVGQMTGVAHDGDGLGASFGDYDNDGDVDIYLSNWGEPNTLYRNEGNGKFVDVTRQAGVGNQGPGTAAVFGDYDNDGDLDLYVLNGTVLPAGVPEIETNVLYQNNGNGTFTDVTGEAGVDKTGFGEGAAFADFDNDGDLDLYVVNWGKSNYLYLNQGDGSFEEVGKAAEVRNPSNSLDLGVGDIDSDGQVDIYLANGFPGGRADRLYHNEGNSNHWVEVVVSGTQSNRDGIGAMVTVWSGREKQVRMVDSENRVLHFGLGDRNRIDKIEVVWPSGQKQVVSAPPIDQQITIQEDEGPLSAEPEAEIQIVTLGGVKRLALEE